MYRLIHGYGWWPDEQPSEEIKQNVEQKLDELSWNVDVVLSHTVPLKYEPTEVFLEGLDQSKVDRTTEEWLDKIEDRLNYQKWYCGHYHTEKKVDKIEIMFENIKKFGVDERHFNGIIRKNGKNYHMVAFDLGHKINEIESKIQKFDIVYYPEKTLYLSLIHI